MTQEQIQLAQQTSANINQINAWLQQAHQDAVALVKLPDDQLLQPQAQTQLRNVIAQINNAYNGQPGQVGGRQLGDDIVHLARFDIFQCPQDNTNNPWRN